jgi:hypothetical protein
MGLLNVGCFRKVINFTSLNAKIQAEKEKTGRWVDRILYVDSLRFVSV